MKGGVIVSQLQEAERGSGCADLEQARDVLAELRLLRAAVGAEAAEQLKAWRPRIERRSFLLSAHNLAAYLALRRRDLRGCNWR